MLLLCLLVGYHAFIQWLHFALNLWPVKLHFVHVIVNTLHCVAELSVEFDASIQFIMLIDYVINAVTLFCEFGYTLKSVATNTVTPMKVHTRKWSSIEI